MGYMRDLLNRRLDGFTIPAASQAAAALQPFMAKLRQNSGDVTILVIGDSTGAQETMDDSHPYWVYRFLQLLRADWPAYSSKYVRWNSANSAYNLPNVGLTTVTAGTGANSINLYNFSIPGTTWPYAFNPSIFETGVGAVQPDLVIFNFSHNEGSTQGNSGSGGGFYGQFRDRATAAIEQIRLHFPGATVALVSQNPEPATSAIPLLQTYRAQKLREIAHRSGYAFIDANQALRDAGAGTVLASPYADGYTYSDGVHPNAAGSELWAATVKDSFRYLPGVQPSPQRPPTLTEFVDNLLTNGDFADWAPNGPAGWTASNATLSQDTANVRSGQWGARAVVAATGTASYIEQAVPCKDLAGHWVTLAALMYVPATQDGAGSQLPQLALTDLSTLNQGSQPFQINQYHGSFRWQQVTARIPATATTFRARIYVNPGTTAFGDVTIDRVILTRGLSPKDMDGLDRA